MAFVTLGSKSVGDIVKLKENETSVDYIVVHHGRPSTDYDDSCDGTWLLRKDILETRAWHSSNVNDYANSTIKSYLDSTVLARFDSNIQAKIKQVKIPYRPGKGDSTEVSSGSNGLSCKIFLLSMAEVGFGNVSYIPFEGAVLDYFEGCSSIGKDSKRVANIKGSAKNWWLRTPYRANNALLVESDGNYDFFSCTFTGEGVRFALILPSSLLVFDDGSVSANTAPTTPSSITIPGSIRGGSTIEISWGASTDAEDNLAGYIVERSIDGGSTWVQIYQGSAQSTTNNVAFGTVSIMYRVNAYDTDGLSSSWQTGNSATVINNKAPSAPDGITVPDAVNAGLPVVISWGESYDSDGSISGYCLERQLDGGEWAELYNGPERSYTDTIDKGRKTVAYRVRACDDYGAFSGYAVSDTRAVNNNTAPVIAGQEADLGLQTGGFSVNYSITDAENDAVTVTESVDGVQLRSYQPELGQEQTATISREVWLTLPNGNHRLQVLASDGIMSSERVWTFSKRETVICFHLSAPKETDEAVQKVLISPTWKTTGAAVKVEACNNAFDDAPAWEDITGMVLTNRAYHFQNTTKTADKWGLDVRFTMEKNEDYDGEVSISGFGGAYE